MTRHDSDRRRAPRAPLLRSVDINHNGTVSTGRIVDLSVIGAFIETPETIPLDSKCNLSFTLPGGKQLYLDCVVCYLHPELGIGVEFKQLSDGDKELIRNCVAMLK